MGIKSELGQKIKTMRLNRNLTQAELAEKIDVSQRTLSGIEIGENFVTADTLDKIVVAVDTNFEELFATNHYKEVPILKKELEQIIVKLSDNRLKLEILYNVGKSLLKE